MDETGWVFKALQEKGLAEKKSQARGRKKSKTRLAIAFFVNAARGKGMEPLVWWKTLKTLRGYPDPMAFVTTPIRKHG